VKLRYRQAEQKVADALLADLPKDIDLGYICGLKAVPSLPMVDMVEKKTLSPHRSHVDLIYGRFHLAKTSGCFTKFLSVLNP